MKNTPFNNPFKVKFKRIEDSHIIVTKRIELDLDEAVVIKNLNKEIISINDLQPKDLLRIKTSDTKPFKILSIQVLPPVKDNLNKTPKTPKTPKT